MQPNPVVLTAIVGLPFLGAALVPFVYRGIGERTAYFAAGVSAVCFALVATQFAAVAGHGSGVVASTWVPALGVSLAFYVDGLAALIGFLASGVGVLVFVYSGAYMHAEPGKQRYYATLLCFLGAMLGVAFAADLLVLFVFWELTSVASFLLIGHYRDAEGQYAARKSMLITVTGGLFMLAGFLVLAAVAGDLPGIVSGFRLAGDGSLLANAGAVQAALREQGLLVPVLLLIGLGAATKSAQVPFHSWLPDAMAAPTPVSAFLHSATMVKAGVYLVGRFRPLLITEEWTLLFAVLGLATMTVTAVLAVAASDIKELLAYSTASHLGLIVAGYGIAHSAEVSLLGAETGAFHVLNHALFKATLFLVAGIVAHEAGTRRISELGGLRSELPVTAAVTAVAALGMAGVPPFNGFYSKELLFEATYALGHEAGGLWWLLPVVAVLGSVFTFLYSIRFLMLFFGEKPDALGDVHRPPLGMLVPPTLLATLAGLVGLGGVTATFGVHLPFVDGFVESVIASSVTGEHGGFGYHLPTHVTPYALMSAATILLGTAAYPYYGTLRDGIRRLIAVDPLRPNWYYNGATESLARTTVSDRVQTGSLHTYAAALVLSVSALALGGYAVAGVELPSFGSLGVTAPIVVVLLVAVVGASAVTDAPSHIAGVLTLSILGFMIAIFYILTDAPDLALTQLVVETLVLVIFLLVLDKLPAFYGDSPPRRTITDAAVAGVIGVTVTLTVLVTTAASPADPIAQFFVENAGVPAEHGQYLLEFGGGHNVVNVILVDFRAFDTMGEISVVSMAALSVVTLLAMRKRGETK